MSTIDHAPERTGNAFILLFSGMRPGMILRWIAKRYRALVGRTLVMDMCDFDDAQLADIGLIRSDLNHALSVPLSSDPTLHLVRSRRDPLRGLKRL
jgi:hypothetical protein